MDWRFITVPIKIVLTLLLSIILIYCAWVLIAFRDIPVENLERKYGGNNLQQVNIDGVNLRYKVEGSGPVVVLIHSHFYTMRQWQPWVDVLKDRFTLVRYDLTSHGLTGPDPKNDYSRARGAELLDGLINHLNIDKASIVGSSTGAGIAYYYAAEYPDKINKLVLINAPGMPKVSNKYMQRELPDWGGVLLYLLPESLFKPFLQAPVIDKKLITDSSVEEFHEMYRRDGNRMAEYQRLLQWDKSDISPLLNKITSQTLVMWGEDNPQLPVDHVQLFVEKLTNAPQVQQIIYPNIGHVIPLELPIRSAKDTAEFLETEHKLAREESE
ncbi:alpha/beta fold hydrolase [Thalassotalea mangrovi]|uniref:Alpha/beta hydrolase n=1 Tax=Thalassotalea mangrovi TaxID=2572245 RepID=A0A4U1B7T1_9GAMM|nr:alpha/beta hydrolase [Thalassotalea mangrovi]TKB46042.1 alpha/beta hydrolase [Thalassotalea mangrovi]